MVFRVKFLHAVSKHMKWILHIGGEMYLADPLCRNESNFTV